MLNQLAAKGRRLSSRCGGLSEMKIHIWSRAAAGRDIEALLKSSWSRRERAPRSRCPTNEMNTTSPLVSLELRSVSAEYAGVRRVGRDVGADQNCRFRGLLVANQEKHSEAQRLGPRHFSCISVAPWRPQPERQRSRLLVIDLAVAAPILRRDVRWVCGRKRTRLCRARA